MDQSIPDFLNNISRISLIDWFDLDLDSVFESIVSMRRCTWVKKSRGQVVQIFTKIPGWRVKAFRTKLPGGSPILGFIAFLKTSFFENFFGWSCLCLTWPNLNLPNQTFQLNYLTLPSLTCFSHGHPQGGQGGALDR
jgi:hypothetical protein